MVEGMGFAFWDEGTRDSLWEFMKDPTEENFSPFARNLFINMVGMGIFKGAGGPTPMDLAQQGGPEARAQLGAERQVKRAAEAVSEAELQALGQSTGVRPETLQGVRSREQGADARLRQELTRLDQQPSDRATREALQGQGFGELGTRIRRQGEREAELERKGYEIEGQGETMAGPGKSEIGRLARQVQSREGRKTPGERQEEAYVVMRDPQTGRVEVGRTRGGERKVTTSEASQAILRRLKESGDLEGFRRMKEEGAVQMHSHPQGGSVSPADMASFLQTSRSSKQGPEHRCGPRGGLRDPEAAWGRGSPRGGRDGCQGRPAEDPAGSVLPRDP